MATLTIRIDDELHSRLKSLATERRRSLNNLIEVLLWMAVEDDVPEPLTQEINRRTS